MYLFKTSGETFRSVITNEVHAFRGRPQAWDPGELVLVSKNHADLRPRERQSEYTMEIRDIRSLRPGESDRYWPGTEGRWRYLVECENTRRLEKPFNLDEALGQDARPYRTVQTFKRIEPQHEVRILRRLLPESS